MKIRKGGRVVFDCEIADTPWKKFKGIMFKRAFKPLFFDFDKRRPAIHSFFCPSFHAIFVNDKKQVVHVELVKPWRPWVEPREPARYLIESPDSGGVQVGDELRW